MEPQVHLEENHEALSNQILALVFLLLLSGWLYRLCTSRSNDAGQALPALTEQAISLMLGLLTGMLIIYPPFWKAKAKQVET